MKRLALFLLVLTACGGVQDPTTTTPHEWPARNACDTSCTVPQYTDHATDPAVDPKRDALCRERAKTDAFSRYSETSVYFREMMERRLYRECLASASH